MSTVTSLNPQEAHQLLDRLNPERFTEVAKLKVALTSTPQSWEEYLVSLPVEDEELSSEFIEELKLAQEQAKQGKLIPHDEILREFGIIK